MRRVLDGPIGQQILTSTENRGLIGLCFYDAGARSFYSTHRPIRHVDSYEVAARLKAEAAGVKVIDDVDRKSFADVLVPLYPTLAPQPRLQAMVQQAQADGDIASEP
jgi:TRAP-type C4-dicarboxylate transport system substrate-binding protein